MRLHELRKMVNETVNQERRKSRQRPRRNFNTLIESTVLKVLQEEDKMADPGEIMNAAGSPPVTLVVLYGPPAAGKGAAKGLVGKFAKIAEEEGESFENYLDSLGDDAETQMQEEDKWMVGMTAKLGALVFTELANRMKAGEEYGAIIPEYFHTNESGKKFELSKLVPAGFMERLLEKHEGDVNKVVEYLMSQNKVKDYFTQARGFSKEIDGAPDELNSLLGTDEEGKTLGVRLASQARYLDDVKDEISSLFSDVDRVKKGKYASVYLVDQAGESTTTQNEERIAKLGQLKEEYPEGALTIIGIYVDQPAKRTEFANYHRASMGGRRVAQAEVDRIFQAAPEIVDGQIKTKGSVLEAMESANFDQIHVFTPPNPVADDAAATDVSGTSVPIGNAICEPLGAGTGHLDIEGCDKNSTGGGTSASSFKDLEQSAMKNADMDGDLIPEDISDEDAKTLADAINKIGFKNIDAGLVKKYISSIKPSKARGASKHGETPWGGVLFGKGTSPTDKITVKESIDLRRWHKLAGLLKD